MNVAKVIALIVGAGFLVYATYVMYLLSYNGTNPLQ